MTFDLTSLLGNTNALSDDIFLCMLLDKCMTVLFQESEILSVAMKWLEATSTQLLMANAALIIANIARSGMLDIAFVIGRGPCCFLQLCNPP